MIIELLTNMRMGNGTVMFAGRYDSSNKDFPQDLWDEIEIHKKTGRGTLRIIQDDPPAQPKISRDQRETTIDDESTFTTTTAKDEKPRKKSRRKKSS